MTYQKTLASGSKLEVTMSSFEVGHRLFKASMKEIEKVHLDLGLKNRSLSDLMSSNLSDEALNTLKNLMTRVVSSEAIEEVLWECMDKATYNKVRISPLTFEPENARADYLEVFKEVFWYNLNPFLKNLSSTLVGLFTKSTNTLKSV